MPADSTNIETNVKLEHSQETTSEIGPHSTDSSFNTFLTEFSSNQQFQLTRINFPFKVKVLDIEDKEETITISKAEWQHLNLLDTAGIETRQYDAYSQTTEVADNMAIIKLRGIDNGIRIDYIFELREGNWYLKRKIDSST